MHSEVGKGILTYVVHFAQNALSLAAAQNLAKSPLHSLTSARMEGGPADYQGPLKRY